MKLVKIFGAAAVMGWLGYYLTSTQGPAWSVAELTAIIVLGLGTLEDSVNRLWRVKKNRDHPDLDD